MKTPHQKMTIHLLVKFKINIYLEKKNPNNALHLFINPPSHQLPSVSLSAKMLVIDCWYHSTIYFHDHRQSWMIIKFHCVYVLQFGYDNCKIFISLQQLKIIWLIYSSQSAYQRYLINRLLNKWLDLFWRAIT